MNTPRLWEGFNRRGKQRPFKTAQLGIAKYTRLGASRDVWIYGSSIRQVKSPAVALVQNVLVVGSETSSRPNRAWSATGCVRPIRCLFLMAAWGTKLYSYPAPWDPQSDPVHISHRVVSKAEGPTQWALSVKAWLNLMSKEQSLECIYCRRRSACHIVCNADRPEICRFSAHWGTLIALRSPLQPFYLWRCFFIVSRYDH